MSGKLDNETLNLMESPRCDNPDVQPTSKRQRRNGRNWFSIKEQFGGTNGRWTKNDLTFKIVEYTQQVSTSEVGCCNCNIAYLQLQVHNSLATAMKMWSEVTPLTFTETTGEADIEVSFVR